MAAGTRGALWQLNSSCGGSNAKGDDSRLLALSPTSAVSHGVSRIV